METAIFKYEAEEVLAEVQNLTPHQVTILREGQEWFSLRKPEGVPLPRVAMERREVSPGCYLNTPGETQGLPPVRRGVLLMVSGLVLSANPERPDLIAPGQLVRDENGRPVGAEGLSVGPLFRQALSACPSVPMGPRPIGSEAY